MHDMRENQISKLTLTEVNQAQSFIRYKRRWPARLKSLLYLGIALILSSGAGSAMTDRNANNYWETSPTTAEVYQKDYSDDQLIYGNSDLIFGSGFALGVAFMACGLFFFWKYNTCCLVECKLREQEIRLKASEYPTPPSKGRAEIKRDHPLTQQERDEQYPQPPPRQTLDA
jgi:hypothetical protein